MEQCCQFDLVSFSTVLLNFLEIIKDYYDSSRYDGLKQIIDLMSRRDTVHFPYKNSEELKKALSKFFIRETWNFRIKFGDFLVPTTGKNFHFNKKIRIPVSGSILFVPEIFKIIDTPQFQRLRGVKQLGPTSFIFPGATHSRFEHSLGTYHLSLRYLEKLTQLPEFITFCDSVETTVKLTVLSALLHDIGHYPYSHWVEEITGWPKKISLDSHEKRAENIIKKSEIGKLIKKEWNIEIESVSRIIQETGINNQEKVVQSILHKILDLDKLDYLVRDSIHCGVDYGKGLDIERLLESLFFQNDPDNPRICLTNKGRTYLLSLLTCRNIMYHEVYWHKTVRACTGMFKTLFFELVKHETISKPLMKQLFELTDDLFVSNLSKLIPENSNLFPLIKPFTYGGREIYKQVYDCDKLGKDAKVFEGLINVDYNKIFECSRKLAKKIGQKINLDISQFDIIIETTPAKEAMKTHEISEFEIFNLRKNDYEKLGYQIETLNEFLTKNQHVYVFCNPRIYHEVSKIQNNEWKDLMINIKK